MHDVLRACQHRHARTPLIRPVLAPGNGTGVTKVTADALPGCHDGFILPSAFPPALRASAAADEVTP